MKIAQALKLTLPSAIVASLCCLSPLVFVLFGASATSFGVVLFTKTLGPYEWAFFLAGAAFLGGSLIAYFRSRDICTLDQVRARRREVVNTALVVGVAAVVLFGMVYGAVTVAGHSVGLW
jgi:hypothetical protein